MDQALTTTNFSLVSRGQNPNFDLERFAGQKFFQSPSDVGHGHTVNSHIDYSDREAKSVFQGYTRVLSENGFILTILSMSIFGLTEIAKETTEQELQTQFKELVSRWKQEVQFTSSMGEITANPYYLRIIGMGSRAIPLLLHELEREPDYWFVALTALTGEDPIKSGDRGNLEVMEKIWIKWGKQNGFI
jgi:hypothetical protein